jgi:hypothetical protein
MGRGLDMLYPVFTDIPIGAWSATMLLDLAWLNDDSEGVARSADIYNGARHR